jgi:hypothetical protein
MIIQYKQDALIPKVQDSRKKLVSPSGIPIYLEETKRNTFSTENFDKSIINSFSIAVQSIPKYARELLVYFVIKEPTKKIKKTHMAAYDNYVELNIKQGFLLLPCLTNFIRERLQHEIAHLFSDKLVKEGIHRYKIEGTDESPLAKEKWKQHRLSEILRLQEFHDWLVTQKDLESVEGAFERFCKETNISISELEELLDRIDPLCLALSIDEKIRQAEKSELEASLKKIFKTPRFLARFFTNLLRRPIEYAFTPYGSTQPIEGIADGWSLFWKALNDPRTKLILKENYPTSFNWMESVHEQKLAENKN